MSRSAASLIGVALARTTMLRKVLFAGRHDWANFAHRIARALRSVGVDARVLVEQLHPYAYVEDTWADGELDAWAADGVDWLLSTGDGAYDYLHAVRASVRHRNLGTLHVGSAYRAHHQDFNARDLELGARLQFVGADSLRFATDALPAYPMWVAAEHWKRPDESRDGVLHCPSNRYGKGTEHIIAAAEQAGVELTLLERAAPGDVIAAMGRAAVYVDELNAHVGGMGCAAVEAAAMGCAVITDGRHWPVHERWTPPFVQVRDRDDLAIVLDALRCSYRTVRTGWQMHHAFRHYRYACEYATQEYVGKYWLELLTEHAA